MAAFNFGGSSGSGGDKPDFRKMMGPGQVSQAIASAMQQCWMMLPESKKTLDDWETEIRRIFERSVANYKEDLQRFEDDSAP